MSATTASVKEHRALPEQTAFSSSAWRTAHWLDRRTRPIWDCARPVVNGVTVSGPHKRDLHNFHMQKLKKVDCLPRLLHGRRRYDRRSRQDGGPSCRGSVYQSGGRPVMRVLSFFLRGSFCPLQKDLSPGKIPETIASIR
jgi:hypothetical protein